MSKRPSFQFYPNDWTGDTDLQTCSMASQGIWINLLCRMHNSPIYGKLLLEQKPSKDFPEGKLIPIKGQKLANSIGRSLNEIEPLITELLEAGVLREDEDGVYYSKRMVEDERIRLIRATAGSKGGYKSTQTFAQAKYKQSIEQNRTPSSSSSSSSSLKENIIKENFSNPNLETELIQDHTWNLTLQREFDWFWETYDKARGKSTTRYQFLLITETELAQIKIHLPKYIQSTPDKQFRKDPANYLTEKEFQNEVIFPKNNEPVKKSAGFVLGKR